MSAHSVIELAAGVILHTQTQPGDLLVVMPASEDDNDSTFSLAQEESFAY